MANRFFRNFNTGGGGGTSSGGASSGGGGVGGLSGYLPPPGNIGLSSANVDSQLEHGLRQEGNLPGAQALHQLGLLGPELYGVLGGTADRPIRASDIPAAQIRANEDTRRIAGENRERGLNVLDAGLAGIGQGEAEILARELATMQAQGLNLDPLRQGVLARSGAANAAALENFELGQAARGVGGGASALEAAQIDAARRANTAAALAELEQFGLQNRSEGLRTLSSINAGDAGMRQALLAQLAEAILSTEFAAPDFSPLAVAPESFIVAGRY